MSSFDLVYQHFPDQELAIRRRLKTDDSLRAICSDYCEAQSALSHWEAAGPDGSGRVAQYRTLVDELAEELAARLRRAESDPAGPTKPRSSERRTQRRTYDNGDPHR